MQKRKQKSCKQSLFIRKENNTNMAYHILYVFVWLISLLPLKVLYVLSNGIYFIVYHVVKYRRQVVQNNLRSSFPERDENDLQKIEKDFYHFFSDYIVETIKLCSMSKKQMYRRVQFDGVEEMVNALHDKQKNFAFLYLAHYGNWEWISSLSARITDVNPNVVGGQIYHPLRNIAFNRLFLYMRGRFGGKNIGMKETLRFILRNRRDKKPTIMGFIADQAPKWNSIHHWTEFLHHNTPVFVGTEQIGKQVDALIFYAHVERPKRGYYHCTISLITDNAKAHPDYELTDTYFSMLEKSIQANPSLWLWTHKRWKRTYEEYLQRINEKA